MILSILPLLFSFITFCKADTINFITPTNGQVFKSSVVNVNYQIQRNGMLFISNTTTDLLDNKGTLLKSVFTDTTVNNNVNIQLTANTKSNYNIRITGFGKYNLISDGTTNVLFMNIQNVIPVSVDVSKPNAVVFNPPSTRTTTVLATGTATRNPIVGVLQPKTTVSVNSTTATATAIASNGDVNVNNKISLSILVVFIMMFSL